MAYHPTLNPIVDGTKITGAWMEYVEDQLDLLSVYANGAMPFDYIIKKNGANYEAYAPATGLAFTNTDCSTVVQACINALHDIGGLIRFTTANFVFNTKLTIPAQTHSLKFEGVIGYTESGSTTGTTFTSTIDNDALFEQESTIDYRSSYGLEWSHIIFVGPHTANSTCLRLTNATTGEIAHCMFFGFGIAIWGDMNHNAIVPGNYDLIVQEMPGLFDIHDNIFTESHTCDIKFDMFMQSKIHDNEFEDWGPFTSRIILINTNVIQIGNNRFTGNDASVAMTEVIQITTDNQIYCNQIHINDNIVYMGTGGANFYPFIDMDNTYAPATPVSDIVSRDNDLILDYVPTVANLLALKMYDINADVVTYGTIDAHDHIRTLNDENNMKDFSGSLADDTFYTNYWAPLHLNVIMNSITQDRGFTLSLGKSTATAQIVAKYVTADASANDVVSLSMDIPTNWVFKYTKIGAPVLESAYGVYH